MTLQLKVFSTSFVLYSIYNLAFHIIELDLSDGFVVPFRNSGCIAAAASAASVLSSLSVERSISRRFKISYRFKKSVERSQLQNSGVLRIVLYRGIDVSTPFM